jgi:UDP-N-acetylmuramoylalanine--D-glutamate ligase
MTATRNGEAGAMAPDVRGKRVLVYSLGIEGRDLARWLLKNGASVTISDTRSDAQLAGAGATAPEGVDRVFSGGPLVDAQGFDMVAVSQSILRHDPSPGPAAWRPDYLPDAPSSNCGAVIGITGSSGKSTTTALVGAMAKAAGVEHVVGGNIGEALLSRVDDIHETAAVILEISHTQLQYTDRSPHIAAVTNVTPNHLDQFSWDEYVGLKRNILAFQVRDDIAVMNADDPTSRALMASVKGKLWRTSLLGEVDGPGAWLEGNTVVLRTGRHPEAVLPAEGAAPWAAQPRERGDGLRNCGRRQTPPPMPGAAVRSFRGVPHRQVVGRALWRYMGQPTASPPLRAHHRPARAFEQAVVLLLGGRERTCRWMRSTLARDRCRAVVCSARPDRSSTRR